MQEHVESGLFKAFIEHQAIERFIINTHAFHNAHRLHASLPRSLVVPIPLHQDREAKHIEIAGNLHIAQEIKRTTTKSRAAQKKLVAPNSAEDSSAEPGKHKRLRMEVADGEAVNTQL
jgi:hypothetical protein